MYRSQFINRLAALCITTVLALSTAYAQSIFDSWSELKSFHDVMSQTFHPAEQGDLSPIKSRSAEMAEKAQILAKSTAPAAFNTPAILGATKRLQKGSKSLHKLIGKGVAGDEQITASLTALHDVFHEIVGLCRDEMK